MAGAAPKLPGRLTLPSGVVVQLRRGPIEDEAPVSAAADAPLFEEVLSALDEGRVLVTEDGVRVDPRNLLLRDFHVLRAVLSRSRIIDEDEIERPCRNCGEPIVARPCATLEIGPFVDGELADPELDLTLPFGEPIEVAQLPLGRVRTAKSVTFEDRTVAEAMPLLRAVGRGDSTIDARIVRALGIVALDSERDQQRIAAALTSCDDAAFATVADAFLASHYVARLTAVVFCKGCGARNDLDAPDQRELVTDLDEAPPRQRADGAMFPELATFVACANAIARPLLAVAPADQVRLVVEDGVPAVDDGGVPLLGAYDPPHEDEARVQRGPVVTLYYRTFRASWDEDGPYDWEDELTETIEHELSHHVYFLRGDDPMDDEEREEIRDEAVRIVGRRETGRRELRGFGASLREFVVRTWPIWVIAGLALAITLAQC